MHYRHANWESTTVTYYLLYKGRFNLGFMGRNVITNVNVKMRLFVTNLMVAASVLANGKESTVREVGLYTYYSLSVMFVCLSFNPC